MPNYPGYTLIRSKKRKQPMALQLRQDGSLIIRAPYRTPDQEVERFFRERQGWIERKLAERAEKGACPKGPDFVDGEEFLYLGEGYPLDVEKAEGVRPRLTLFHGRFILTCEEQETARNLFARWFRKQAQEEIPRRVGFWSRKLDLVPGGVRISSARTRYGSCSARNQLSFTWRLMMTPPAVIDYVVVHELIHIREKNHSARFWAQVEKVLPDYRTRRVWLKEHRNLLMLGI